MKTVFVIAKQTVFGYAKDRLFHSSLVFSILFILFCYFLSSLSIVETRKVMLDFGLSAISLTGIVISLFLGITIVGMEVEKRTVYSVLSKPIGRHSYLIGRLLGGAVVAAIVHGFNLLSLSLLLYALGEGFPPGLLAATYLMTLESILIMGVALFCSLSTSSLLLASAISIAVFLIGRSGQTLRIVSEKTQSELARALLRILYDVFPSLDRFNIRELVAYAKPYPQEMLFTSSAYFLAYLFLMIAASVLVFRKKDF